MKILLYDIEATNLNANFGFILCIGYQILEVNQGGVEAITDVQTIRIDDYPEYVLDRTNDKRVVSDFREIWDSCDAAVSWYGGESRFDRPYIRTRMLYHGLFGDLAPIPDIDLWYTSRKRLKLTNNRLATVQDFLDLDSSKTSLKPRQWIRAMAGYKDALDYVVEHCFMDVEVLRQAYVRLLPYIPQHPNANRTLPDGLEMDARCPKCLSTKLVRRGFYYTQVGAMQRYRCNTCGTWTKSPGSKPWSQRVAR